MKTWLHFEVSFLCTTPFWASRRSCGDRNPKFSGTEKETGIPDFSTKPLLPVGIGIKFGPCRTRRDNGPMRMMRSGRRLSSSSSRGEQCLWGDSALLYHPLPLRWFLRRKIKSLLMPYQGKRFRELSRLWLRIRPLDLIVFFLFSLCSIDYYSVRCGC